MTNPTDVFEKVVSRSGGVSDPVHVIANCIKALDHLKSQNDPKMNMSIGFIQSEISKALIKITFKSKPKISVKAVNKNVQTRH